MEKPSKPPTLMLRSAYFIDKLREVTGQGFVKLEERIRINQFEKYGLIPPPFETVRDYFRLRRPVAFEPNQKVAFPSWLLAAEVEVKDSSFAYFHPLFDLLFGCPESSCFWDAHFRMIPTEWIDQEMLKGDKQIAEEWRLMNEAISVRKHRKRETNHSDSLSFIHLSLLRLPNPIINTLFEQQGLAPGWVRKYGPPDEEASFLKSIRSFDSLAALFGLVKEGAEIGDTARRNAAKAALLDNLSVLDELAACRRISEKLKQIINEELKHYSSCRRYTATLRHGFGVPISWRHNLHELAWKK